MREQVVRMRQNGARIANMSLSLLSSISLTFLIFNLRHAKRRVVSSAGRGTYNGGRGKKRVPSPLSSIHRRSRVSFEVKSEDPRSPSANPTRRSRALYSSVGIRVSRLARGSYLTTRQRFLTERKYLAFEDSFLPFIFSFFPPSSNSIRRLIFRAPRELSPLFRSWCRFNIPIFLDDESFFMQTHRIFQKNCNEFFRKYRSKNDVIW